MIDLFLGKYEFLSNFFPSRIEFEGMVYPTNEHFFQAMKSLDPLERKTIMEAATPGRAKRLGRKITMRSDWETIKSDIMLQGLRLKFSDPKLAALLLATGDEILIEGTTWHDNEWGNCTCEACKLIPGQNKLGKLLMQVREELRNS